MSITDLDGKEIAVTHLATAIMQADDYRHYRVKKPSAYLYIFMIIGKMFTKNCYYWIPI